MYDRPNFSECFKVMRIQQNTHAATALFYQKRELFSDVITYILETTNRSLYHNQWMRWNQNDLSLRMFLEELSRDQVARAAVISLPGRVRFAPVDFLL